MPDHPLLLFPQPTIAEKARRFGGGARFISPTPQDQSQRLAPKFGRLQDVLNRRRLELQGNAHGLQPEQVLVLETIGPVEKFVNIVKKLEGLEWLGEFEVEDIPPEYGFEFEEEPDKALDGQVFLVMTDQQALQEIYNLFIAWQRDPEIKFPLGLAPLKNAFAHLRNIRPWDTRDRLAETGILEDWQERINVGQEIVPFEAELWFRQEPLRRTQALNYVTELINELGGEVVSQCVISDIAYHGILGRIPIQNVPEIANLDNVRLFACEDVMHLRPVGQCAVDLDEPGHIEDLGNLDNLENPGGSPVIALFDGLPLARHQLLDGRLVIDDPDGYAEAYQVQETVHGTAMASLICHGDLSAGEVPLDRPIYVRPVMAPKRAFLGNSQEAIPESILPVDLIHRSVRRLFEQVDGEPAAAPGIRIINLSIGDQSRVFDKAMSSWARLLDWLSSKYSVLFIVSAGNHRREIELGIPRNELAGLTRDDRESEVIRAIASDTRHRRLLSPAETLNGITVAAAHDDEAGPINYPLLFDPYLTPKLPTTISAHGPGFRRSIKPDILLPGGRVLLSELLGNAHPSAILKPVLSTQSPGVRVAAPGNSGELNRSLFTRGTSNSTALASRWAAILLDLITRMRLEDGVEIPEEYDVVLTKALLVHGADWSDAGTRYDELLRNANNSRSFRDYVSRFLGYGYADVSRVLNCTDHRVTVLGYGELNDGEGHEFSFPMPPSLAALAERRRMTFTLAWISPIMPTRQKYRVAHLYLDPKNTLTPNRICGDHRAVQRGTVQHEILEGTQALDFQDGESIGFKVSCRAEVGTIDQPVRYGLVATMELAEEIGIPIYQEVEQRIRLRVPIVGPN